VLLRHLPRRPSHPLPTSAWYVPLPKPPPSYDSLLTPRTVWVKRGLCSADSIINILLLLLGYIPGLIHAWYIIAKFPDEDYDYDAIPHHDSEGGGYRRGGERVRYIIIDRTDVRSAKPQNQNQQPQQGPNYGTQGGQSSRPAPQQQGVTSAGNGEGSADGAVPPSYAEVVAGDHKIQTRD
jgi:uncharacterized membrane protein YqaE (UPF0057 family)